MEPTEYATLYRQEERFWWYRGLHRLAEESLRSAWASTAVPPTLHERRTADEISGGALPITRILDAGCGAGGMLPRLSAWSEAFGLDFSPHALAFARRRGPFPLTRGSVESLPYRSGTFDLVLSLDVLYHRGVSSDIAALREFRRCLRPGGALLLNLPAFESLRSSHDAAIHTARRYRRGPLRDLLIEAGLRPVRLTHWNSALFPGLALVRRWRRRRAVEVTPQSDVTDLPAPLNGLLLGVLALERAWLRTADLPFGLSILAIARRPEEDGV